MRRIAEIPPFLPRDAMRKRGLCGGPMSVCSTQTAEDIVKLLPQPGSRVILVFLAPSAGTKFQWEPFQQWRKYTGVE